MKASTRVTLALAALLGSSVALADEPLTIGATFALRSEVLGGERTILVSTPRGYERGRRFPVLYLTDGESHFLHTIGTVDFLSRNGRISPLIVVGVMNGPNTRTRDLTPTHVAADGAGRALPESGGGDLFLRFLETELIPRIETTYRTFPYRILAGHSLGGLFALHVLATRPGLFGGILAASPSLHWDGELPTRELRALFTSGRPLAATLYVTLGNEGPAQKGNLDRLRDLLKRERPRGFEWEIRELLDDDHGSVVLKTYYEGLLKVYEGWGLRRDPATGTFKGDLGDVKDHVAKLSKRFGYAVPPPEGVVNNLGHGNLAAGRVDRALEAFRLNLDSHPESANAHDSLGEGLEAKGDLPAARASYAKAVELGRAASDPLVEAFQRHLDAIDAKLKERGSPP